MSTSTDTAPAVGGDLPPLVGTLELAAMFGVKPQTAYEWRSEQLRGVARKPLPAPRIVSGTPVWSEAELVAWGEDAGKTYNPRWRDTFQTSS